MERRNLLFPASVAMGVLQESPFAAMLHEHEIGRNYVKTMSEVYATYMEGDEYSAKNIIKNAYGHISLMRGHIEKEISSICDCRQPLVKQKTARII